MVDLPPGVLPDRLVSACNGVEGVEVIWFSRYGAGGGLHMDLEAVEQMTSAPAEAIDILVEQAPSVLHADWAALLDGTGGEVKVALETSATPEFGAWSSSGCRWRRRRRWPRRTTRAWSSRCWSPLRWSPTGGCS